MTDTLPLAANIDDQPAVIVEAFVLDERTGERWIHKDLVQAVKPWQIGPPKANEQFGDVKSWASYVKEHGFNPAAAFLTWNSAGLRAVLDYHTSDGMEGEPGRCQWAASHPFVKSPEWEAWMRLCTGQAVNQRTAIERLEDLAADITDPPPADLMNLLRNLRSSVHATAQTELLPDGTTRVGFSQDKAVKGITDVALPPEFTIAIPVLKGHDTRYRLAVKLRASVDDSAHLTLRFTVPQAERALEAVYAAVVGSAKALLGESFTLLRAAG